MVWGGLAAVFLAMVIGYACFRFGVIGDYFALVTLKKSTSITFPWLS